MIKNYFKTAWRNLGKNKTFSFINILGLSIGVSCFLLIALYIWDELSYDRYNVHAGQIYRVNNHVKFGDFSYDGAEVPAVMGPVFKKDFPQIAQYVRFKNYGDFLVKKGAENLKEDKAAYADSTLFDVFTLPLIAGNPVTALKEPHSVVITESTAKKYFNSTDVIGNTLLVNNTNNYEITAVIKDIPRESHFNFNFIFSMPEAEQSRDNSWFNYNFQTYLLIRPGTNAELLEKQLNERLMANATPQFQSILNISKDAFEKSGNSLAVTLMPLTKIHLHSNISDELGTNGSIQYVYIFSAISIFILLIACVNFMNLSTARSSDRAREVGMRKVFGGRKNNLIFQFLTESVLISLLSFLFAIAIVLTGLPLFNQLAGKEINVTSLLHPLVLFGILLLMIIVGAIAGSYPAFVLSSFKPIEVLKGKFSRGFKGSAIRNVLVVFQFSISIGLMIGTIVILNQLNYIRNKDLGFNKDHVLVLRQTYGLDTHSFRNELMQMPGVKKVTVSGFLPVSGNRGSSGFTTTPVFDGKNFVLMQEWAVDENYIPTLLLHLKSGRNFSPAFPTDSGAVIINEAAAKVLSSNDALNKKLYKIKDLKTGELIANNIIGVISNFNFNSLHEQVTPLVLKLGSDNGSMALRINTEDIAGLLSQIKSTWKAMAPSQPLSYTFLDDEFNKMYNAEQRTGNLFITFAVFAIFIACLGLFGLVTYAAEQRVKEIGIRKVLGARVSEIVTMISKDFVKLVLIAFVIAFPVAWWAMNKWLQGFAYRVNIGWWAFALAGFLTLAIALITVSFQAIKAAVANPVKSLRSE